MIVFRGRVWCFGDDLNTDLMMPISVIPLPRQERPQYVFQANRPGWSGQVRPGDLLVAGSNFGMGSGRSAAQVLKDLGLACLLAETINGLFFRNCVNFALPALEVAGVRAAFVEGDEAEVHFSAGRVVNLRTGAELTTNPWPESAVRTLNAGGLDAQLESEGLLHPVGWSPPLDE
jgi:3-isopropylmalate/(R)-2-methylmalate dehydratase small subunit